MAGWYSKNNWQDCQDYSVCRFKHLFSFCNKAKWSKQWPPEMCGKIWGWCLRSKIAQSGLKTWSDLGIFSDCEAAQYLPLYPSHSLHPHLKCRTCALCRSRKAWLSIRLQRSWAGKEAGPFLLPLPCLSPLGIVPQKTTDNFWLIYHVFSHWVLSKWWHPR